MEVGSKTTQQKHVDMVKSCKAMKPEERLVAFFNHSHLMAQVHQAGADFNHHQKLSMKKNEN